jgi:hypothetical protein
MRGRLSVAVDRKPCEVLDLRVYRLEKARAVTFKESDGNAVAIKHAVAGERRELRPWRKNAG